MLLRGFTRDRTLMMRVMLISIALGPIALHYLPRVPGISADLADGIGGLCYGVAFGCFFLAVRAKR